MEEKLLYQILPDTRKFSNKKLFQFEKSDFRIFTVHRTDTGEGRQDDVNRVQCQLLEHLIMFITNFSTIVINTLS